MCEFLEIGKTRTTSYQPSANDQVERYNRSITQIIKCCIGDRHDFVGIVLEAIREIVNRSTRFAPNRMMLGREVMIVLISGLIQYQYDFKSSIIQLLTLS